MRRVIFVGIHHKPDTPALCSSTLTGKRVDMIIEKLPKGTKTVKTNLFDKDYLLTGFDAIDSIDRFMCSVCPLENDVVVLLGGEVNKRWSHFVKTITESIEHPASPRLNNNLNGYINSAANQISQHL